MVRSASRPRPGAATISAPPPTLDQVDPAERARSCLRQTEHAGRIPNPARQYPRGWLLPLNNSRRIACPREARKRRREERCGRYENRGMTPAFRIQIRSAALGLVGLAKAWSSGSSPPFPPSCSRSGSASSSIARPSSAKAGGSSPGKKRAGPRSLHFIGISVAGWFHVKIPRCFYPGRSLQVAMGDMESI